MCIKLQIHDYRSNRLVGPVTAEIETGVQICISGQDGVFSLAGILKIMYVPLGFFFLNFELHFLFMVAK